MGGIDLVDFEPQELRVRSPEVARIDFDFQVKQIVLVPGIETAVLDPGIALALGIGIVVLVLGIVLGIGAVVLDLDTVVDIHCIGDIADTGGIVVDTADIVPTHQAQVVYHHIVEVPKVDKLA